MFETGEIPMTVLPDGRSFITEQNATEFPWVRAFIGRFSNYWRHDLDRNGWISPKIGEP